MGRGCHAGVTNNYIQMALWRAYPANSSCVRLCCAVGCSEMLICRPGRDVVISICGGMYCLQESKIKSMSLRSNLAVRRGDTKEVVYRCGRAVQTDSRHACTHARSGGGAGTARPAAALLARAVGWQIEGVAMLAVRVPSGCLPPGVVLAGFCPTSWAGRCRL